MGLFVVGVRKAMVAFGSAQSIDDAVFADITILEVNLEELLCRQAFSGWPSYMPFVDAIYLCYDVSDASSYDSFPQLIGEIFILHGNVNWLRQNS